MATDTRLDLGVELERRVLARGGVRSDIALVLRERRDVLDECARLIVSAVRETKDRIELSIFVKDGETFESLVAAGKYDWKRDFVTAKRFPVRPHLVGERKLVLLHFGRVMSSEDAIAYASNQGLERPTYEDCLRFGAEHPEVQHQFPVIFLHEPVQDVGVNPGVLCLLRSGSGRGLGCSWFGHDWLVGCRFAFVCKPA